MTPPTNNWSGGKIKPNIAPKRKQQWTPQHGTQNIKTHNLTTQKMKKISNTDPTKNRG
jgi:hypothetical protein